MFLGVQTPFVNRKINNEEMRILELLVGYLNLGMKRYMQFSSYYGYNAWNILEKMAKDNWVILDYRFQIFIIMITPDGLNHYYQNGGRLKLCNENILSELEELS